MMLAKVVMFVLLIAAVRWFCKLPGPKEQL